MNLNNLTTFAGGLACLLLVYGCADDGAPELNDTMGSTGGTDTDTPLTTSTTDATATDPSTSGSTTAATTAGMLPEILNIDIIANPQSVLSATIEVETSVDIDITVAMTASGGEPIELGWESVTGTMHVVPVLGMTAETDFTFEVTVEDANGETASDDSLTFTTEALPAEMPPIDVQIDDPAGVAPGVTLFDVFRWNPGVDPEYGFIIGLDETGEVVWYYRDLEQVQDIKPSEDGNLIIINADSDLIRKIDMMGNELFSVSAEDLGIDSFHHEIIELPNGNLVSLGSDLRNIDGFEGGGTAFDVVADTIVEFTEDGTLVDEINFFDLYDPVADNIEPLFSNPFWNTQYPEAIDGTKDWTHGNAIIYDADDDSYLVSVRHLLLLAKVSRADGTLTWSLGENRDFTLVGNAEWQYGQHAPELQSDGSLLLFDNGNLRPVQNNNYSRVVQYDIDETNMEVSELWSWQAPFFAPFVGDADRMSNGNVLVGAGGRVEDEAAGVGAPDNRKFAQIIELTGDPNPARVMTITLSDEAAVDPTGYTVYRAERIPGLYQVE